MQWRGSYHASIAWSVTKGDREVLAIAISFRLVVVTRGLTNEANRPRADGAKASPAWLVRARSRCRQSDVPSRRSGCVSVGIRVPRWRRGPGRRTGGRRAARGRLRGGGAGGPTRGRRAAG